MNSGDVLVDAPQRAPWSLGRYVLGALLLIAGGVWLLDVFDVVSVPVLTLLPVALILVGVALAVAALRGDRHRGLVALGVVLTLVLSLLATVESVFDLPWSGGVGERRVAPVTGASLDEPIRLAAGELVVDLRDTEFEPGTTDVTATLVVGELVVRVPRRLGVRVVARASMGEVVFFGEQTAGVDVREDLRSEGFGAAPRRVVLRLAVGIGSVKVTR